MISVDYARCFLTDHAREVIERRKIPTRLIVTTLAQPQTVVPSKGAHRFKHGPLVVVVADAFTAEPVVVTLLLSSEWHADQRWTDADARSIFNPH